MIAAHKGIGKFATGNSSCIMIPITLTSKTNCEIMEDQTDDRRRKYLVEMLEFLSDNNGGITLNEVASRRFLFN
jgi:hypothetical protein